MTRKSEIGLAVGVLVLLIIVVIAFMLRQPVKSAIVSDASVVPITTSNGTQLPPPGGIEGVVPAPVANPQTATMIFVERFSSYSSESNFANVKDVLSLVTASLSTKIQAVATEQRAKGIDQAYYGISTKVISQNVQEQTDTVATIIVSTQRAESIGSPSNATVRYQDVTVKLIKEGEAWKVDDFTWAI